MPLSISDRAARSNRLRPGHNQLENCEIMSGGPPFKRLESSSNVRRREYSDDQIKIRWRIRHE